MKLPITFCLFTSTRGHFERRDRYMLTLDSFEKFLPLHFYANSIAHIKISPGETDLASNMSVHLNFRVKEIMNTMGNWTHGNDSHQREYLRDMTRVYCSNKIKSEYVLHCEDDWIIKTDERFDDLLMSSVNFLEKNPDILSVRFPRYSNEPERIRNLKNKHNLDRRAERYDDNFWISDDFSMNPSIFRARDIRAAVLATQALNVPQHVEHGLGQVLAKVLTPYPLPFAFFDPSIVRIGHVGTPKGQEDDLSQPLIAT